MHRVSFSKFSFACFFSDLELRHTCIDTSMTIAHLMIGCYDKILSFPTFLLCFQSDWRTRFNNPRLILANNSVEPQEVQTPFANPSGKIAHKAIDTSANEFKSEFTQVACESIRFFHRLSPKRISKTYLHSQVKLWTQNTTMKFLSVEQSFTYLALLTASSDTAASCALFPLTCCISLITDLELFSWQS